MTDKLSDELSVQMSGLDGGPVTITFTTFLNILDRVKTLEQRLEEVESERDMLRTVLDDTDKAELLEALEQSTKEALELKQRVERQAEHITQTDGSIENRNEKVRKWKRLHNELGKMYAKLKQRVEGLENGHEQIVEWSKAYPLDVFPEADFKKAAELLKAGGMTLDAISASNMRHVVKGVGKIAKEALAAEEEA